MAYELTKRTSLLSAQINQEPNIILEIDGIPYVFGATPVTRELRYGDDYDYGDEGLYYGGVVKQGNQLDWISLQGTSTSISQQITPDKGGQSSVQSMKVRVIDKDSFLTKIFRPSEIVPDLLGRDAVVWFSYQGGSHPEDSIALIQGVVSDYDFGAGNCYITVSHPEQLKRQELLPKINTKLVGAIDDITTTIELDDVTGFIIPANALSSFVRIDDELIQYTGTSGNFLTGVARGALGSIADSHDVDADVESFYRLQGNAIDLALKVYLSDENNSNYQDITVTQINQISPTDLIQNALLVGQVDPVLYYGISQGDLCSLVGSSQDFTDAVIASVNQLDTGDYYIIISGPVLSTEINVSYTLSLKSKYNVLPFGMGLNPKQVDVPQHELLFTLFNSQLPDYDIYIKDTVKGKEFIDTEIYFPSSVYSIPRKGKISCNITTPPLATLGTKIVDSSNVVNPDKIVIKRSINKYFYNAIVFKFEQDSVEDKFLSGRIYQSADSTNRIKIGNRPLTIEATALRDNALTRNQLDIIARRLIDRYQYGAEHTKVQVNLKTGFNLEVGDTVIFGDEDLKISDSNTGTRAFEQRIMEIQNKSLNYKTGQVDLDLVDTAYQLDGRYTVISPSSYVGIGSTTTKIILKNSFNTNDLSNETEKWGDYIGQKIQIRSSDYSIIYNTEIVEIDPVNKQALIVKPITAPIENMIVEAPIYSNISSKDGRLWKLLHASFNPSIEVVSSASQSVFDVVNPSVFVVGLPVRLHNDDFSEYSIESKVIDVTGSTITVDKDLGFLPNSTHRVELIGFIDDGQPYRYL